MIKNDQIVIKGAREHNLKNIDINIPRDKLVVITGLSGSGKSSLAFDTIYAEGQRRYVESLSAYARQFLGQMNKPDVDSIEGLSPAVSIDQKTTSRNPRSTVGTITEIYDYFRLLYARIGKPICPKHKIYITSQTIEQMVDRILEIPTGKKVQILAPVVQERKGTHSKIIDELRRQGFSRILINNDMYMLEDEINLDKKRKYNISVIVDRIAIKNEIKTRLSDSLEVALKIANGIVIIDIVGEKELLFSEHHACPHCGFSINELEPKLFSFNSPFGACPACDGLGTKTNVSPDLVIPNKNLSIEENAISPWSSTTSTFYPQLLRAFCTNFNVPMDMPISKLSKDQLDMLLFGVKNKKFTFTYENDNGRKHEMETTFPGIIPHVESRFKDTSSESVRKHFEQYLSKSTCPSCKGERLKTEALAVKIEDKSIMELTTLSITQALTFITNLNLTPKEKQISRLVIREIEERLGFLKNIGLDYLTLARASGTLSGGEAQRIRLATQIGSRLTGVLYILDEPSIGLHQRDNDRLIKTLKSMRDLGNSLIVVEHDEDTMLASDYLIDIGPGAGIHGGKIISAGTPSEVMTDPHSLTGEYLSGKKSIPVPKTRRSSNGKTIKIKAATENNLKNISVTFPLGVFIAVTGVSGSGKSTLINSILHKSLAQKINKASARPGAHGSISGIEHIEKIVNIDQSPIGRTPRSNPATYTKVFDNIRDVFAMTNEAMIRGYNKGRFSFNVKGGRCEACRGDGIIKIEMHFLPDVYVPCEVCHGKRYNRETLEVLYKGKNIADIIALTVEDALKFFEHIPNIKNRLQTLADVGLGYITLGQSATTLSGGEAQRVKLASELHRRSNGKSFYILDEPTTGLHVHDIAKLIDVLKRLVENGDTVLVIEHNLDVIKVADHIIDLGPEGGDRGGEIIAVGTPEQICQIPASYTGKYLKKVLKKQGAETHV